MRGIVSITSKGLPWFYGESELVAESHRPHFLRAWKIMKI